MLANCEKFVQERKYLLGVTDHTIKWYRASLVWLPNESPSQQEINEIVVRMKRRGMSASSVNCRFRAINGYLHWNVAGMAKCGAGCAGVKHPHGLRLKELQKTPEIFSQADVEKFLKYKPRTSGQHRLKTIILLLCDIGARANEVLSLKWTDVDFDNLLLTLTGKGQKQRKVPFSFEMRRVLYKHKENSDSRYDVLFCTRDGGKLDRRDVWRDTRALCRELGIVTPERTLHAFRHSFSVSYLRRGGSVFHLQKVLGHSTLEMTRRYANLTTADLSAVHEKLTMLRPQ
jgi:integrase/recombinase XerD